MTDAVIEGDYTDLRFIKGRKCAQIVIEIAIERAAEFVQAFGTPQPDKSVPVAVARLIQKEQRSAELKQQLTESVEIEKRKGGELAKRAGIMCCERSFETFLYERKGFSGDPAEFVRSHCVIRSRAELDHDRDAAIRFSNLAREYGAWLQI